MMVSWLPKPVGMNIGKVIIFIVNQSVISCLACQPLVWAELICCTGDGGSYVTIPALTPTRTVLGYSLFVL